jgi:hypothetical protein
MAPSTSPSKLLDVEVLLQIHQTNASKDHGERYSSHRQQKPEIDVMKIHLD